MVQGCLEFRVPTALNGTMMPNVAQRRCINSAVLDSVRNLGRPYQLTLSPKTHTPRPLNTWTRGPLNHKLFACPGADWDNLFAGKGKQRVEIDTPAH